jgi:hypothetical protein
MPEPDQNRFSEKKHSWWGIVSVVMAIVIPLSWILFYLLANLETELEKPMHFFAVPFVVLGLIAPVSHFIAAIIGGIGLISKKTKNLYPLIGLILNLVLGDLEF